MLEEVFELLQSGGYDPARVLELRDYTWGRPKGEPAQEVGGSHGDLGGLLPGPSASTCTRPAETELARIWTKVPQIRAKQAAIALSASVEVGSITHRRGGFEESGPWGSTTTWESPPAPACPT